MHWYWLSIERVGKIKCISPNFQLINSLCPFFSVIHLKHTNSQICSVVRKGNGFKFEHRSVMRINIMLFLWKILCVWCVHVWSLYMNVPVCLRVHVISNLYAYLCSHCKLLINSIYFEMFSNYSCILYFVHQVNWCWDIGKNFKVINVQILVISLGRGYMCMLKIV